MNVFLQDENDKVTSSPQGGDRTRKPHVWHKLVDYISVRYKGFCSRKKTYIVSFHQRIRMQRLLNRLNGGGLVLWDPQVTTPKLCITSETWLVLTQLYFLGPRESER